MPIIAVVDTLKYLRKGGRISGVTALAGEMLSINALGYSGLNDAYLKKYLQDSEVLWKEHIEDVNKIPSYMIGSTIGTHVGPNAIGVAFYAKNK